MVNDPTLTESKIIAPGWGVQGKNGPENISPPRPSLENSARSHQPLLDTKELTLPGAFDVTRVTEDLSYLEPATLARKILSSTPYDPRYCEEMVAFFLGKDKTKNLVENYLWRNTGEVQERIKVVANPPPMFSEFGRTIGVSEKTLKNWAKKNKEFAEAYEICQDIIQEFMVENGLTGNYSSQFGIFTAKNLTKMKDVQVNKNENYDMKSILDAIEKGQHDELN